MKQKLLVLGRHGKCPQRAGGGSIDALLPETVREIYEGVGVPLNKQISGEGIVPERVCLVHTQYERTTLTGQAVLAGALGMLPKEGTNPPQSQEDLAHYDFSGIKMIEDPRLCYKKTWANMDFVKNGNYDACIDFWLANPDAKEHEGVLIAPYVAVSSTCGSAVKDAVARLISGDSDMGVVVAHATTIEPAVLALIGTARETPVREIIEIGGGFNMAEFAQLTIEKDREIYKAILDLRNQEYEVSLDVLFR